MKETGQEGNKKEKMGNVDRAGEDSRRERGKRRAGWAVVQKRDFHGTRRRLAGKAARAAFSSSGALRFLSRRNTAERRDTLQKRRGM